MINYYPEGAEPINVTSFETVFYGQSFVVGSTANSNFVPTTGFMPAADVYLIDLKMDDGKPATGYILPTVALWGLCVSGTGLSDVNATYISDDSSKNCGLVFRNII